MIALLLVFLNSVALAQVPTYYSVQSALPSLIKGGGQLEEMKVKYSCVAKYNGEIYDCPIRSEFLGFILDVPLNRIVGSLPSFDCNAVKDNISVEDLLIYGGHNHDKTSRKFTYQASDYLLNGLSTGGDKYVVQGNTSKTVAELTYKTPVKAGITQLLTTLTAADHPHKNYVWLFSSGFNIDINIETHIIAVQGFNRMWGCVDEPLTEPNASYVLSRGDEIEHPEANWGLRDTINVATDLANSVFRRYRRQISYNDMGLPMGGHHEPHTTHRTGKDFDLNANTMGYDCNSSADEHQYIEDEFADLYGTDKTAFPNLDCYANGFIHIDAVSGL